MVPSLIPYDLPFPQNGGSYAPKIREWPYLLSATGDLIHFMFGSRVGFSGSADRMTLFPVTSIPSWRPSCPPSWIISNGHSSATAHSIHLYSAHRAVIVAIAQLSCFIYLVSSSGRITRGPEGGLAPLKDRVAPSKHLVWEGTRGPLKGPPLKSPIKFSTWLQHINIILSTDSPALSPLHDW